MSDEDEDLGAMAWPGFVDILSSVIIMFVFFVMVVASALYFHILIFKAKILAEINEATSAQATMQELATTNRSLTEKIQEMTEDMKVLEKISKDNEIQLFKEDSGFSESAEQDVTVDSTSNTITVFFGEDSISLVEETQIQIKAYIDKFSKDYSAENVRINIQSNKNPDSVNDLISRRLAVARMLNVRNSFLESEIPTDQLEANIVDEEPVNDTYNWVKITFERK